MVLADIYSFPFANWLKGAFFCYLSVGFSISKKVHDSNEYLNGTSDFATSIFTHSSACDGSLTALSILGTRGDFQRISFLMKGYARGEGSGLGTAAARVATVVHFQSQALELPHAGEDVAKRRKKKNQSHVFWTYKRIKAYPSILLSLHKDFFRSYTLFCWAGAIVSLHFWMLTSENTMRLETCTSGPFQNSVALVFCFYRWNLK